MIFHIFRMNVEKLVEEIREIIDNDLSSNEWVDPISDYYEKHLTIPSYAFNEITNRMRTNSKILSRLMEIKKLDQNFINNFVIKILKPPEETVFTDSDSEIILQDDTASPQNIITSEVLKAQQTQLVGQVVSFLSIHEDAAFFLLQYYKWSLDRLYQNYVDNPRPALLEYGLTKEILNQPLGFKPSKNDGECVICADTFDASQLLCLQCGHSFCINCWKDHIEYQVQLGSPRITCMEQGCKCTLLGKDIMQICGDKVANGYHGFLLDNQISIINQVKRCLNPKCHNLLTLDSVWLCNLSRCECGSLMCWKCGDESHAPATCNEKSKWLEISEEEVMQNQWLTQNTKICPKCKARIEKNGGCNHMTCSRCSYEFCWVCSGEWSQHGGSFYECHRPKPADPNGGNVITDLDRMSHYHTRYNNHKQNSTNMKEQRSLILANIIKRFEFLNHQHDEATKKAESILSTIHFARTILIWSYPHAYFLPPNSPSFTLYDHCLKNAEVVLEDLVYLAENPAKSTLNSYEIACKTVEMNIESLLRHAEYYQ